MKKSLTFAALVLLALAAVALTVTAEEVIERKMVLKIAADGDMLDLDLSNLEVGDTQQFFTDGGKEVVVTRNEDEYVIEVEGRDEPITVPAGDHGHAFMIERECDDAETDCEVMVDKHVVMHGGDGSGSHSMVFMSDDGEVHHLGDGEGHHWVSATGADGDDVHVIRMGGGDAAAERLLASGVLDDLDESKRQEILEALSAGDGHGKVKIKVKKLHRHEDE